MKKKWKTKTSSRFILILPKKVMKKQLVQVDWATALLELDPLRMSSARKLKVLRKEMNDPQMVGCSTNKKNLQQASRESLNNLLLHYKINSKTLRMKNTIYKSNCYKRNKRLLRSFTKETQRSLPTLDVKPLMISISTCLYRGNSCFRLSCRILRRTETNVSLIKS